MPVTEGGGAKELGRTKKWLNKLMKACAIGGESLESCLGTSHIGFIKGVVIRRDL